MSDFTFLTEEQCFGDNKLDILKKRGAEAAITDFSILLGGLYMEDDDSFIGNYWINLPYGESYVGRIGEFGEIEYQHHDMRICSARVALPFSYVSKIPTNGKSGRKAKDGILEVEYGYYPQKAASKNMQKKLEIAYKQRRMTKTGNSYTTDSREHDAYYSSFQAQTHQEYEFEGKRYVRVKANVYDYNDVDYRFILSNKEEYKKEDDIWIEVLPVKWLVDEKAKIMITEKLIFSGVQFNHESNYHTENFNKTDIKKFMDTYLARDLVQTRETITIRRTNRRKPRNRTNKNKIGKIKSRQNKASRQDENDRYRNNTKLD